MISLFQGGCGHNLLRGFFVLAVSRNGRDNALRALVRHSSAKSTNYVRGSPIAASFHKYYGFIQSRELGTPCRILGNKRSLCYDAVYNCLVLLSVGPEPGFRQ